jgi:hypothetical protein
MSEAFVHTSHKARLADSQPGQGIRRAFAVSVPANAGPGEYITSFVLENDQRIRGTGAVALNQIVRQAVAGSTSTNGSSCRGRLEHVGWTRRTSVARRPARKSTWASTISIVAG